MTTTHELLSKNFLVLPSDIPNDGILFVDHQKHGRSGHGGNCLTECTNGDIVSFYSNVSGEISEGHSPAGWSEYRISTDGGKTWGESAVLNFSKRAWEGDEIYSALVFAVATAPDGTLIAFVSQFASADWVKQLPPVCLLSHDQGQTWSEPRPLDPKATVEDVSLTFDAVFTSGDQVFAFFMGGAPTYCDEPHSLYVSTDNGKSFVRRSDLPFDNDCYYVTAGLLDNGDIIVYSYPYRPDIPDGDIDEYNMPYVTSADEGRTWSEVKTSHFAQAIRNPQMSRKIGDLYFLHGRSGEYSRDPSNLVLYASYDGIRWDEGRILHRKSGQADAYSANEVVGKYDSAAPNRLLIQSSIAYDGLKVNECHWWVQEVNGT